ncbi:myosin light chain kinase, smooth muscle-like isoform X2 [Betta splendens]|uniref:Myosin light chain kinase, smooth muscle-like isoform X2 n=1 Tax=Betta splendens TaxID=158456 RepID=A0A6P7L7C0_BETSP|nr:myosin light chain kinase, smooth muscle-like isoform X2 [Betta splendens]
MDEDQRKTKTCVSTFRWVLRPQGWTKEKANGPSGTDGAAAARSKPGPPPATGPKPNLEPPRFRERLRDCSISEGSDATFQGVVSGSRPLTVSWFHDGQRVHTRHASFRNGVASLFLTRCPPGSAGVYTCVAENPAGQESSGAVLRVTAAEVPELTANELHGDDPGRHQDAGPEPCGEETQTDRGSLHFVDPPNHVEVAVGEQARLHCGFRSSSLPVASCWIYNKDRVVEAGPGVSVRTGETQSSLVISRACARDTGSYTVVVRNQKCSAAHTISLAVIDRPDPPASQPVVSQMSAQALVLSWMGPSYDGGTAVLGYVVEVREEGGAGGPGNWTQLTNQCKNTCYHVRSGLEPLGQYRFRVRAYNAAGSSEPSRESECVTMATERVKKEEPESYVTLSVDTEHKVRDHYNVHEQLGVGKFGKVFRLSHKETGQVCAGKFYQARVAKDKLAARREIELMKCLHHPKLVQCLAAYHTRSEIVMVMEYIAGGELFQRIVAENFEHTEPTCVRYVQQILDGMLYVHRQNIVHLDLKPENIVCVDTTGMQIKIIDFGLAAKLDEGKPLLVMHGTPEFAAPEVIGYEPVGVETDMWSIGVICFILLSGESPFQGNSDAETLALVTAACYEFDEESFEDISDLAKDFISSLLQKDRKSRLSCAKALAHPWMASFPALKGRATKSLKKDKMRRFLARRKWKKTGKAVLALKRMANLSNRPDSPGGFLEEPGWSPAAEEAIRALDRQLRSEPRFQRALTDAAVARGATAQLSCLVSGHPQPAVKWLHRDEPVSESLRVSAKRDGDGLCSLVVLDAQPSDSGVYVCSASNALGEATCSARLRVEL